MLQFYNELRTFAHEALLWHLNLVHTAGIMLSDIVFYSIFYICVSDAIFIKQRYKKRQKSQKITPPPHHPQCNGSSFETTPRLLVPLVMHVWV